MVKQVSYFLFCYLTIKQYFFIIDKTEDLESCNIFCVLGGNLQECFERKTEYIGSDLNIANNGQRNKVTISMAR